MTSELKDAGSPISVFMTAELPQLRELAAVFQAVWADDAEALQPPVAAGTLVAWGTFDAAIDHRVRHAFSDSHALTSTPTRPWFIPRQVGTNRGRNGSAMALQRKA